MEFSIYQRHMPYWKTEGISLLIHCTGGYTNELNIDKFSNS